MKDNEDQNKFRKEKDNMKEKNKDETIKKERKWSFCPHCGEKLPDIEKLRYCINCGLDLVELELPPDNHLNTYEQYEIFPQYRGSFTGYKSIRKKLTEEDIYHIKDKKLWGITASIGIPLLAFVVMNLFVGAILVIIILYTPTLVEVYDFILNPYFIIITSLIEFILVFFPIIYVGKYLERPTLKNRLELLGFTTEGYNRKEIYKEFLIGSGFALLGIFLVGSVALFIQFLLSFFLGPDFINAIESTPPSDIDIIISSADIIALILLVIVMILVIGISEEILFRGFLQKGLVRNIGNKWGILITAFIFALIHLLSLFFDEYVSLFSFFINFIWLFFPYFAISLMLGLLYYWRKENLIAVIVAHGLYNSLTIIIAFLYYGSF